MLTSGTLVYHTNTNVAQSIMQDILGLGENGYGLPIINSVPAEESESIRARPLNLLIDDINIVYEHITNVSTATSHAVTGTTVVSASYLNEITSTAEWLNDPIRRYTCHPSQFYFDTSTNTSTFISSDSTSTRTLPWGVDSNEIKHRLVSSFPDRLAARYYFNLGSYLTFIPFYLGTTGLNDLDAEWADFIDYLNLPEQKYTYRRSEFVNWSSTSTSWTSGTLAVSVIANRAEDETGIEFIVSYKNNASATLIVTPSVATWSILV